MWSPQIGPDRPDGGDAASLRSAQDLETLRQQLRQELAQAENTCSFSGC